GQQISGPSGGNRPTTRAKRPRRSVASGGAQTPIAVAWLVFSPGASLTPSPSIATLRPLTRRSRTTSIFRSGSTSASTCVIASFVATASAVRRLSPVSITIVSPARRNCSSAFGADSLVRVGSRRHGDHLRRREPERRAGGARRRVRRVLGRGAERDPARGPDRAAARLSPHVHDHRRWYHLGP